MRPLFFVASFILSQIAFAESKSTDVETLRQIVEINSGTSNQAGVLKVQQWFEGELSSLGFKTEIQKSNLLLAEKEGSNKKFITFLTHADTVFDPTHAFQRFDLSGDTAKGPGVIDAKGGMLVILKTLKEHLKDQKYSLRVVSSPAEETGTQGYLADLPKYAASSLLVLGFEPALDNGNIVNERRGNRWYLVKVTGKEAHAGRAHKDGRNACVELSEKLVRIAKLTDYSKDVTVSVGRIDGGQNKFNIVCGFAEAKIDTRFSTRKDRDRLHEKIMKILNSTYVQGTTTAVVIDNDAPPMAKNVASAGYVKVLAKIISEKEHRTITAEKSGGASDANYMSEPGVAIVDGLGPVGGKMHTAEEFIDLKTLETRSQALVEFLKTL